MEQPIVSRRLWFLLTLVGTIVATVGLWLSANWQDIVDLHKQKRIHGLLNTLQREGANWTGVIATRSNRGLSSHQCAELLQMLSSDPHDVKRITRVPELNEEDKFPLPAVIPDLIVYLGDGISTQNTVGSMVQVSCLTNANDVAMSFSVSRGAYKGVYEVSGSVKMKAMVWLGSISGTPIKE